MATNIPKLVPVKDNGGTLETTPSLERPVERHFTSCHAQDQVDKPLMAYGKCRGALYCSEQYTQENPQSPSKVVL
jgi:hypothetical protein